jgi:mitogen-activated protein kinase kinase kinase
VPPSEPDGKLVSWYTRVLDSVRLRTRRLYRFSRNVHTRLENSTEYLYAPQNQLTLSNALSSNGYYLYYTDYFEKRGMYLIVPPAMACRPEHVKHILNRCFIMPKSADSDVHVEDRYVLLIASKGFTWEGPVVHVPIVNDDISVKPNRIRLVTEHGHMLNACHRKFMQHAAACELQRVSLQRPNLCCINAHYQKVKRAAFYLGQTLIKSTAKIRCLTVGQEGHADLIQSWHTFTADYVERIIRHVDPVLHDIMSQDLMRLSIHWVTFLCEDCDQNDRKTFRWVVNALETTMSATADDNILRLTPTEFAHLRRMVAGCMTLLITHVDVHGARGSFEARAAELERRQALENVMFSESSISKRAWRTASIRRSAHPSGTTTPEGSSAGAVPLDESKLSPLSSTSENNLMYYADDSSLMYVRDEWLRQIKELEQRYAEKQRDSRLIGRVLDDDRPETRDLVFLASSSSNISLRWQQGKYIGGGTFGSVYLGINMDSGALMAVKEVRFQDASSLSSAYRGVRDEMAVLERLCHPNIVSYYGIEVHRDKVYIFMEYCQGGTLATLLEHGRIEDEDLIRVYAAQMLRGVAYLHANNIVHRDIKPDSKYSRLTSSCIFLQWCANTDTLRYPL